MSNTKARWTLVLMGGLAVLSFAGLTLREAAVERPAPPPSPAAIVKTSYSGTSTADVDVVTAPPAPIIAPEPPRVPVERRKARDEGYREAREASWEGELSGCVTSSEGPLANLTVRVEWVLSHQPDREEIARLKRVGARRDKDGTWWARVLALTDEAGCFRFEGLPAVPLRLHAGSTTQQAQVGGFAQVRTERP
jgi:hypothetical protein